LAQDLGRAVVAAARWGDSGIRRSVHQVSTRPLGLHGDGEDARSS